MSAPPSNPPAKATETTTPVQSNGNGTAKTPDADSGKTAGGDPSPLLALSAEEQTKAKESASAGRTGPGNSPSTPHEATTEQKQATTESGTSTSENQTVSKHASDQPADANGSSTTAAEAASKTVPAKRSADSASEDGQTPAPGRRPLSGRKPGAGRLSVRSASSGPEGSLALTGANELDLINDRQVTDKPKKGKKTVGRRSESTGADGETAQGNKGSGDELEEDESGDEEMADAEGQSKKRGKPRARKSDATSDDSKEAARERRREQNRRAQQTLRDKREAAVTGVSSSIHPAHRCRRFADGLPVFPPMLHSFKRSLMTRSASTLVPRTT